MSATQSKTPLPVEKLRECSSKMHGLYQKRINGPTLAEQLSAAKCKIVGLKSVIAELRLELTPGRSVF
jgi:hypothetical protein